MLEIIGFVLAAIFMLFIMFVLPVIIIYALANDEYLNELFDNAEKENPSNKNTDARE